VGLALFPIVRTTAESHDAPAGIVPKPVRLNWRKARRHELPLEHRFASTPSPSPLKFVFALAPLRPKESPTTGTDVVCAEAVNKHESASGHRAHHCAE
jgi:hypothetical protein